MTKLAKTSRTTPSQFFFMRGTDGCDNTFDVVCLKTGSVIASLPYWYQEKETLQETRLLIKALNRFHARGGYFFAAPLLKSLHALQVIDGYDPVAGVGEGGKYDVA
jgi:hypothetical protein